MLVNMRLLLVARMGVFMGAVIPALMRMVVGRGPRGVAVLMLVLMGMGMLVLVGMGMAVGYPLVGV
jgi:TM2 domain-containing membrane protein YozV